MDTAKPNDAHKGLARLEDIGKLKDHLSLKISTDSIRRPATPM